MDWKQVIIQVQYYKIKINGKLPYKYNWNKQSVRYVVWEDDK